MMGRIMKPEKPWSNIIKAIDSEVPFWIVLVVIFSFLGLIYWSMR